VQFAPGGALVQGLDVLKNVLKLKAVRGHQVPGQPIKHEGIVRVGRMAQRQRGSTHAGKLNTPAPRCHQRKTPPAAAPLPPLALFNPAVQAGITNAEFLPPNGLETVSLALGSGNQAPSTTNRYSYRPGPTVRSLTHLPFASAVIGVLSGHHALKEPAIATA